MAKNKEISNEELKRQLLSGSLGQTLKRRHLPLASNLYRSDELVKKNLNVKRVGKTHHYIKTVESIKKKWDSSPEIQRKYEQIRNIISLEIKNLREWELEMVRFGEKHPESMVINDASWHWQQDQYKFVHPRVRQRNGSFQFIKHLKRFGNNKAVQKVKFTELYGEWKACSPDLKLLPWPTVGGQEVDLFELYRSVVLQGGLGRTLKKTTIWKELGAHLRLSGTPDTLFYQLRVIYYKYLMGFEHKHQVAKGRSEEAHCKQLKETWVGVNEDAIDDRSYALDFEYLEDDELRRKKKKKYRKRERERRRKQRSDLKRKRHEMRSIPFDSIHHDLDEYSSDDVFYADPAQKKRKVMTHPQEQSHYEPRDKLTAVNCIDSHNVYGTQSGKYVDTQGMRRHFSAYWNGHHMLKALVFSLKSRISSSVNWALNRLLFLSYNTKSKVAEPFLIKHHGTDLLDALMALMPFVDRKEMDTVNQVDGDRECQRRISHHALSLELTSKCFGRNKSIDLEGLCTIRNDTNSLLDPKMTRVILRILSNLVLTADNQQCVVDHGVWIPYLVELVQRRDVIPSDVCFDDEDNDYSEIHVDAMRVIAHCSERINLAKYTKKVIPSQQPKRYNEKVPSSNITFEEDRYKSNSPQFVRKLISVLSRNLSLNPVIDGKEYKHWMCYYSLLTCCRMAANPNNHGILGQYIISKVVTIDQGQKVDHHKNHSKMEVDEEKKENAVGVKDGDLEPIKMVDLSKTLKINGMVDVSNLMVFGDDANQKEREKEKKKKGDDGKGKGTTAGVKEEFEWILRISGHILSSNCQIKLAAIEALVYLFETNWNFTKYLFADQVVNEVICELVAIGNNEEYGQQLQRSSAYLLSIMYKQCGDQQSQHNFAKFRSRIFESCAQYDDFACYAIRLANVSNVPRVVPR